MQTTSNQLCKQLGFIAATTAFLLATATAQGLRPSGGLANPAAAAPKGDAIVAVVNQEVITALDVQRRALRMQRDFSQKGAAVPSRAELAQQALDLLIDEKVQVSAAREAGVVVDEASLDRAMQQIAQTNNLRLPEFMQRVQDEGYGIVGYRETIREEIVISRLRERDVAGRIRVSDAEIDEFIAEQAGLSGAARNEINIAHLLIAVPERATEAERGTLRAKAERLAAEAKGGADFAALAGQSDASNAKQGGEFGWRNPERYPQPFIAALQDAKTGDIAGPIQTGAGFHVLKLLGKRQSALPAATVPATRVRHIVLREGSEAENTRRLTEMRRQIVAGTATFEALARQFSQDGSGQTGGDLGFQLPRQLVPEFEVAMNALKVGEISGVVSSRFGVHLIQVQERKQQTLTVKETRDQSRELLRDRKTEETTVTWLQDLRSRAYIEMRRE